jgi:hypothetical protein
MKIFRLLSAFLTLAILTFAGCQYGYYDGPGGYGGIGGSVGDIRGRVTANTPAYNSMAMDTSGGQYVFVYDAQTIVRYGNSSYPVQNILVGDQLSVTPRPTSGGPYPIADVITVTSRVSGSGSGSTATVRGRVTANTPAYSSVAMDTSSGQYVFVYDSQTRVRYRNSEFSVQSIQPGDELSVIPRPNTSGSFPVADVITVISKVSGGVSTAIVRGRVTASTPAYNSIAMNTANGQYVFVHDAQTQVRYGNSFFPVQNIQVGDELSVIPRPNTGGSFPVADVITVTSRIRR